jgi:superfamily II DNA helicase RecQ
VLCCFRIAIIKTDLNDQNLFLNFRPFVSFTESLLPRIQECIESKSAFIVYVDDKVTTMELVADIFAALPASVGNLAPVHAALTSSERADITSKFVGGQLLGTVATAAFEMVRDAVFDSLLIVSIVSGYRSPKPSVGDTLSMI